MMSSPAPYPRGGERHAIVIAAMAILALCLALLPPAPCQALGSLSVTSDRHDAGATNGAPPPPNTARQIADIMFPLSLPLLSPDVPAGPPDQSPGQAPAPTANTADRGLPPGQAQDLPLQRRDTAITNSPQEGATAPIARGEWAHDAGIEPASGAPRNGHTLTDIEYKMFRQMVEAGGATPLQVALVNAAVKGTTLLIVAIFWILALVAFRYIFNRWFDEDVYTKTWPSVIVISVMIVCTCMVLIAAVS